MPSSPRLVLQAKSRQPRTRVDGVKGVVYGKEVQNQPISVDANTLDKAYTQAGQNTVLQVVIDDSKQPLNALFEEIQMDPISGNIIHFDLHAVSLKDKVHAEVPVHIVGESPAVISNEGMLTTVQDMVEVESEPLSIPSSFEIDVSSLAQVNDHISIADLDVPEGVTILDALENVLVKIDEIREEEEEPEAEASDVLAEGQESSEGAGEDSKYENEDEASSNQSSTDE